MFVYRGRVRPAPLARAGLVPGATETQQCAPEDTAVAVTVPSASAGWAADPRVLERVDTAIVPTGTVLLRQGRPASAAYVLISGRAKLEQDGRVIAELGAGSIIGELSLLDGGLSPATVTAVTRLELGVISRRLFCAAMIDHPDLLARLFHQFAARVRRGTAPHEWGSVVV